MALTKVSTGVVDMSGNTGGLVIAKGTTAQQPTCDAVYPWFYPREYRFRCKQCSSLYFHWLAVFRRSSSSLNG